MATCPGRQVNVGQENKEEADENMESEVKLWGTRIAGESDGELLCGTN